MPDDEKECDWSAVIAKCLAYLCLKNSDYKDAKVLEQAEFLARLGLPVGDRADILGTTRNSLGVLSRLANKEKGAKKNGKSKRR